MSWRARPAGTAAARASAPRGAPPSAAFPARPLSALMFPPAPCARHCHCDEPGHGGSQGWRNTEGAELHSRPRCHPRPGPLNPRWRLQDASVRTLSCRIVRPLALQASWAGGCCPAARRPPRSPRVPGWFKSISSSATPRVLAQHGGLAHLMLETQSLSLALRGHSSAVSSTTRCRCRMQLAPRAPGPRAPATWKPSPAGTFVLGAVQRVPGQSRSARVLQRGARSHAAQRFR